MVQDVDRLSTLLIGTVVVRHGPRCRQIVNITDRHGRVGHTRGHGRARARAHMCLYSCMSVAYFCLCAHIHAPTHNYATRMHELMHARKHKHTDTHRHTHTHTRHKVTVLSLSLILLSGTHCHCTIEMLQLSTPSSLL